MTDLNGGTNVSIGAIYGGGEFVDGTIDEVRISNVNRYIAPPNGLVASTSDRQVHLTWNKNIEPNFLRYRIFGGTSSNPTTQIDSLSYVGDTLRTISGLNNGTTYYYRLVAVDTALSQSDFSNEVSAVPNPIAGEFVSDVNTLVLLHLNDLNNSSLYDASGNNNSGFATGTSVVEGKYGKARSFDGTSDVVTVNHDGNFGMDPFTVELWVNFNAFGLPGDHQNLIGNREPTGTWWLGVFGDGRINFDGAGGQLTSAPGEITPGMWYHLRVTRDMSNVLRIYKNGILVAQADYAADLSGGTNVSIGASHLGGEFVNGTVDEIRISNVARGVAPPDGLIATPNMTTSYFVDLKWRKNLEPNVLRYRIFAGTSQNPVSQWDSTAGNDTTKAVGVPPPGTVYYFRIKAVDSAGTESDFSNQAIATPQGFLPGEYLLDGNTTLIMHMNEISGSVVTDASGGSHHGTANGTTVVDGRFGKSRSFSTTFESINISHSPSLNFGSGTFTAELWWNTLGLPNISGHPFHKRGTGGFGWMTGIEANGALNVAVNVNSFGDFGVSGTRVVMDGRWHHIAAVISQTDIQLYVDGELDVAATLPTAGSTDNDGELLLGSQGGGSFPFRGMIDEFRLSTGARSPNEFNLQLRPTNLGGTPSLTSVSLAWQNGGGSVPLLRYRIYRGADSTSMSQIDSTTSESYQNSGLSPNTVYFYRVSAIDQSGFESLKSFAAAITTAEQSPAIGSVSFLPNPPLEGTTIDVTANVSGSNPAVQLFYGRGSQSEMDSIVLTPVGGSQYSGSIPASAVTREGLR